MLRPRLLIVVCCKCIPTPSFSADWPAASPPLFKDEVLLDAAAATAAAASALLGGPPRLAHALLVLALARRVHQHGVVLADGAAALVRLVGAGGRGGLVVELLDKGGLDLAAALLPPLLLGLGLGLDLGEALAELGVAGDFVGGLENGRAPVGREGVGLFFSPVSIYKGIPFKGRLLSKHGGASNM